nr:hypothetical protein [Tanacetum cinerariifolium]
VGDFKSLAKEADASLAKHKILELEIELLLKAVVSQDIISIVQNASVVDTSDLQTELERMFRISSDKVSREAKKVPNTVSASSRTKPINVSQPSVVTKKDMNSNLNGLSSTGLDNTKTRRSQPTSNTKNDRDVISKVVCVVCKKYLNSINHDVCLKNYVNGKKSRGRKHKANVSKNETQQKNQPEIKKPKKVGFRKSLATPKPKKPRFLLRWSLTGKMFDQDGKLIVPSNSKSHVDCSNGDNAYTSNSMEPKIKRFPNSTSLLGR